MQRGSELVLGYCGSPFVGTYALNILFVPKLTSYNIAWPIHVCWCLYYPYNDRDPRHRLTVYNLTRREQLLTRTVRRVQH